jgi:hypothetical protein
MPVGVRELVSHARLARAVPSFSRQTGLACSACHYQFPQLTPFGRLFKLNGYSLTGLKVITETNLQKVAGLELIPIAPLSVMTEASVTHLATRLPGTQNDNAAFPQQLSLFFAAAITPHIGTLTQLTYDGAAGTVGIDNTDIRAASRTHLAARDLVYGVTLHNNPTVQDVWNTTPAWGFPFASSGVTPGSVAATAIDGGFAQQVLGLGAYTLWNNLLYVELTGYRSAPQGAANPPDSTSANTINGVTPYWRAALQHQFGKDYGMIGTYGLATHVYPTGVAGPTNAYTDVGFDAQYEHPLFGGVIIGRATWITERQRLTAFAARPAPIAANLHNTLNTIRINASAHPNARYAVTAGYFSTTGSRDTLLYTPAPVTGSGTGRPNTNGVIEEFDFNPWQNTRLALQGVQFTRFNGAATSYDGSGRRASANNTLYALLWVAF